MSMEPPRPGAYHIRERAPFAWRGFWRRHEAPHGRRLRSVRVAWNAAPVGGNRRAGLGRRRGESLIEPTEGIGGGGRRAASACGRWAGGRKRTVSLRSPIGCRRATLIAESLRRSSVLVAPGSSVRALATAYARRSEARWSSRPTGQDTVAFVQVAISSEPNNELHPTRPAKRRPRG